MRKRKRHPSISPPPTPPPAAPSTTKRDLLWLTLAAALAFASSVPGNFVWLDHAEIEEANYRVANAEDWSRVWTQTIEEYQAERSQVRVREGQGGYWRPIYALSVSLDWLLWDGNPWLDHLENILWHLAVVVGLYFLGNQVFGATDEGRRAVFWATLLFAVHPLGVHSVTWISGRKDTMCAAFGVAALVALGHAVRGKEHKESDWGRTFCWLALAAGGLLLSIGSKELGFVVPLVATVLFWPPLLASEAADRRSRAVRLAGLGLLWACVFVMAAYRVGVVKATSLDAAYPSDSLLRNLAMTANLAWHYVFHILVPYEVRLSDAWSVVQTIDAGDAVALIAFFALAGTVAYGWFKNWPWTLGVLWFVIWMLPTSGIMPLRHFRAERYLYPASWGILLAALLLLLPILDRALASYGRRATGVLLALIATLFALKTAYENTYWWQDETLFGRSVAQDPRHVEGHIELSRLALEKENYPESARLALLALEKLRDPSYVAYGVPYYAHSHLGTALVHLQHPAEALEQFRQALRYFPDSPSGYANMAMAEAVAGNLPAAKVHFARALELNPSDNAMRHNLVRTLLILGEYQQAEGHLEILVQSEPNDPGHQARLALCQWKMGKRDDARKTLDFALQQNPQDPAVKQVEQLIGRE